MLKRGLRLAALIALSVSGMSGCDGAQSRTVATVWWLAGFDQTNAIATVVVADGGCQVYDHAAFTRLGSTVRPSLFNRVTHNGPCTANGRASTVTLRLPRPASQVVGGCAPGDNTVTGRICASLVNMYNAGRAPAATGPTR